MIDPLSLSIGVGLVVSLLFSEIFGLAAGGMVVPGYIALHLTQPLSVTLTLGAGLIAYLLVHAISTVAIVYGRRRTVLMILVGYLVGGGIRYGAQMVWTSGDLPFLPVNGVEYSVIGFIIPGLIAIWIDRQGVIETFSSLLTASVVVRLILILSIPGELGT
jgi:poly-gamma-glutamate biosynthesis protein PgsC/CapC